jgi:glycosyltransferase involved in cell wall biosynthesis
MKIGFAGRWSPLDKTAWSGIYYQTYQAILKNYQVEFFHYTWPWHVRESLILHKQFQKVIHKKAAVEFLKTYAKYFSRQLEKELLKKKVDLLFVPAAPQLIAYCKTNIPVIYMTDATFFQLQGYYPLFKDIAAYNIRQGIALDKSAFEKSSHCMLASHWAKQSAITDYGIDENKITIAPFGANLEKIPGVNELKKEKNKVCNLLFLGVEWERKGGQIALDAFRILQKNGFLSHLTIIGCVPPVPVTDKNITVIPFINKQNKAEADKLYDITRNADFLLLPTRAECSGIVFCEAAAFGVPSITTDTGGISTNVQHGINGFTLPLSATADDYAKIIQKIFCDDYTYWELSKNCRKKFEEELNWDHWGNTFLKIAQQTLNN